MNKNAIRMIIICVIDFIIHYKITINVKLSNNVLQGLIST